jgi:hypothetical protein
MTKRLCLTYALLLVLSCSKTGADPENDISIEVSPAELKLSYEAAKQTVAVTANDDWGVSSSESWCTVSPGGGISGTTTLNITVEKNETDTSRSVILTFKSGSNKKEYTVTQKYQVIEVAFTDSALKKYCVENYDTDGDGTVSVSEASVVTSLNVSGLGIGTINGIESFTALLSLNCSNNAITALDLSKLPELTSLDCSGNQLSTLDIRVNVNIKVLDCTDNPLLTTIYVWTGFASDSSFQKPDVASYIEPEITTPAGYNLVWQEEFNDARDDNGKTVLPNSSEWWYETGAGGWGNNELQNYIAAYSGSDTCAKIYNGTLKIIAQKVGSEVLSVRMNTSDSWIYGYFEARLKLPGGKGTWPAFWMMPKNYTAWPDDGEIDIMEEVGYRPNYVSSSIHCKAYYHSIGTQKTAEKYVSTAESEFHVYALEWTAGYIKGYVDGVSYFEFDNDLTGNYDTWPFYNPFYIKLNLAWGGNWGGAEGTDESVLPAVYEIDYVRVFQK